MDIFALIFRRVKATETQAALAECLVQTAYLVGA
jgi:hypothetical protein